MLDEMIVDIHFTEREQQVVELLMLGKTCKQIALALGLSYETVKKHKMRIYKKLPPPTFGRHRHVTLLNYMTAKRRQERLAAQTVEEEAEEEMWEEEE